MKSTAKRNTRSKEYKSGLRSRETIGMIQQSKKDECEGVYVPSKTGVLL